MNEYLDLMKLNKVIRLNSKFINPVAKQILNDYENLLQQNFEFATNTPSYLLFTNRLENIIKEDMGRFIYSLSLTGKIDSSNERELNSFLYTVGSQSITPFVLLINSLKQKEHHKKLRQTDVNYEIYFRIIDGVIEGATFTDMYKKYQLDTDDSWQKLTDRFQKFRRENKFIIRSYIVKKVEDPIKRRNALDKIFKKK